MSRMSRSSHIALWAAVFSLLLKTAVPLLAATAAELRGVPVASVCAIYGVAMPVSTGGGGAAAHAGHPGHGGPTGHAGHGEPAAAVQQAATAEQAGHVGQGNPASQAVPADHAEHVAHAEHAEHHAHASPEVPPAHAEHGSAAAPSGPAHAALHGHADPAGTASHHGEHSHAEDTHGAGHCALTALAALAVPDPAAAGVLPGIQDAAPGHVFSRTVAFHDASAAWVARLKHGPPAAA